ncbi:MAG: DUF1549 and DUF1553 domain-containing protein [Acidobacteriota bacterium]|nr:DUF1549 and DUF1553 domain-containing protein [Acidobacteriota bacterium]
MWSLQSVVRPEVPVGVTKPDNPIDAFIAAKYREKGLYAAGPADKLTLLRRLSFDLTGIPPTPAEQDAFIQDQSPGGYQKVVDRLLADKQHGVRWARHWLDVLRYADLDGLDGSVMPAASGIYLWRDWVISALNRDMPYDQFVRAQILGSRYKEHVSVSAGGRRTKMEGSPEDQFALGFLARSAITRNDKDHDISLSAVDTISTAFMGMTVGCAKCHDHKFDPIKQTGFYAMKAIFDPLVLRKVVLATPAEIFENSRKIEAYNEKKRPLEDAIDLLIAPYRTKLYEERVAMLTADIQAIIRKPERKRTVAEQKIADDYFPVLRIDPPKIKEIMPLEESAKYTALLKQAGALVRPPELATFLTVEEDSALLKDKNYVLTSGDPARPEKDKPVEPGLPFQTEPLDFRDGRREGFVDWLTANDNPLFARVAVNRIWQWHFGEGLQRVSSDFGLLGGKPSNPKLLDYLAAEFVAHGYDMKWLHRLIVTSDTYKLSTRGERGHLANNRKVDPNNTYLWRARLKRLEAEPIWDEILYAAGDLDLAVGGKSFQMKTHDAKQSLFVPRGDTFDSRANRRGIYMARGFIPSTDVMANFLLSFDVDDGRAPCPIRGQTVSAPQALFTMNDKFVEAESAKFAERMLQESSGDLRLAVDLAYRTTLGRPPASSELDRALTYVDGKPDRLKGLAWLLFNLDEFIYVK